MIALTPEAYTRTGTHVTDSLLRISMTADRLLREAIEVVTPGKLLATNMALGSLAVGAHYLISRHGGTQGTALSFFCNVPSSTSPDRHDGYVLTAGITALELSSHATHCGPYICEAALSSTPQIRAANRV